MRKQNETSGTAKHEISADETNFLASIHILLHERKRKTSHSEQETTSSTKLQIRQGSRKNNRIKKLTKRKAQTTKHNVERNKAKREILGIQ